MTYVAPASPSIVPDELFRLGTFASDMSGSYNLDEQSASLAVFCFQAGTGNPITCSASIATPRSVPEPVSLALLGSAMVAFGAFCQRRKR